MATRRSWLLIAAGLAVAGLLQLVVPRTLGAYAEIVFLSIGVNIVLAVSLNLVNGVTGQFSIGHAGFMAVGAYAASKVTLAGGGPGVLWPALVFGGLCAAACGWIVGLPSLRLRGDYLAIVTLGFGEIIRVVIENSPFLGGALGLNNIPPYTNLFNVYAWVVITFAVSVRLVDSTHGRAFLAIRENELAAEAMGVNTTRYKVSAFVISAFFAGVAGGLAAHEIRTVTPTDFNFIRSFEVVIMVVLGGLGSQSGAVVAAVLLTGLSELLRQVQPLLPKAIVSAWPGAPAALVEWAGKDYRMVIYSLLLILLVLLRPRGLFGHGEIWRPRKPTGGAARAEAARG